MPQSQMPFKAVLYDLRPIRGVQDRKFLSTTDNGEKVDLWDKDDDSGRQKWQFIPLEDQSYNIKIFGGVVTERKYLSCSPDGRIDLWVEDDGSGRQRWILKPLMNGSFNIEVAKGTNEGERYLSCTSSGDCVDLWNRDDTSGRQQWQLVPEDIQIDKIDFDVTNAKKMGQPSFVEKQTVSNITDVDQESEVIFQQRAMENSSFQHEHGFTFGIEVEKNIGGTNFAKTSVKVSMSTTNTWTYGRAEEKEDTRTYRMPVKVPARSKVVATAMVIRTKLDIPYTVTGTSKVTGETIRCFGTWTGVEAGELIYSIEKI